MSARRAVVGFLIAVGALAVVGGIASAKLKTRSDRTTITAHGNGSATAKCPHGSEAVAGGFSAPGFDPRFNGRSILSFTSKRTGNRRWKTQGHNFSSTNPQSGKLISYAYCNTHEPDLKVRSKSRVLSAFDPGSATAKCPRGSEAVSGGWTSPDAAGGGKAVFAVASQRIRERKWKVFAYNNDQTSSQRLVAFAYCDKHEPGLNAESNDVKVPSGKKRSVTAHCRHGRKAVSGGFSARVDTNADGPFPFVSKRTKGGDWKASAVGNGSGRHPFKVFAYCK
jgi:hypothetical protein